MFPDTSSRATSTSIEVPFPERGAPSSCAPRTPRPGRRSPPSARSAGRMRGRARRVSRGVALRPPASRCGVLAARRPDRRAVGARERGRRRGRHDPPRRRAARDGGEPGGHRTASGAAGQLRAGARQGASRDRRPAWSRTAVAARTAAGARHLAARPAPGPRPRGEPLPDRARPGVGNLGRDRRLRRPRRSLDGEQRRARDGLRLLGSGFHGATRIRIAWLGRIYRRRTDAHGRFSARLPTRRLTGRRPLLVLQAGRLRLSFAVGNAVGAGGDEAAPPPPPRNAEPPSLTGTPRVGSGFLASADAGPGRSPATATAGCAATRPATAALRCRTRPAPSTRSTTPTPATRSGSRSPR